MSTIGNQHGHHRRLVSSQPTSVAEGTSIMVMVMQVDDKDDKAMNAAEDLTVAIDADWHGRCGGPYTLVGAFTIKSGEMASNRVEH